MSEKSPKPPLPSEMALLDIPRASSYLNNKIRNICLILSVMVLFNHARTLPFNFDVEGAPLAPVDPSDLRAAPLEFFLECFVSGALGRITNPMFFLVSGFFFFYGWQPQWSSWGTKLRKRFYTLFLPYLTWMVIGKTLSFVGFLVTNWERVTQSIARGRISPAEFLDYFLVAKPPAPIWFMEDLMLMMIILVPFLAVIIPRLRWHALWVIVLVYFVEIPSVWSYIGVLFQKVSVCYFSIGAVLGYLKCGMEIKGTALKKFLVGIWVTIALVYVGVELLTDWELRLLLRLLTASGVLGIWALYDLFPSTWRAVLEDYSTYRFFIYMGHDPALRFLMELYYRTVGSTTTTAVIGYSILPLIMTAILIAVATWLRRSIPRFYYFTTGGR